jgi:nondiscriminating glutamyl-tRNA synthetase
MSSPDTEKASTAALNPFTADDLAAILRERGWLSGEPSPEQMAWCGRAAALLGVHAADRAALDELLQLVFQYDAKEIVGRIESHVVLSRYAARDVIRQVARMLLEGGPLTTQRFNEMVDALKTGRELRGRELFHPIRLALTGHAGEGKLDRVILLLDEAASLGFAVHVKSARERILEFCASFD